MWNTPTEDRLSKIPRLYETEHVPLQENWHVAEFDGKDLFWGFAILNDDLQNAEWGYISFNELRSIRVSGWLEIDCTLEEFWQVRKASAIEKIRKAHGWEKTSD